MATVVKYVLKGWGWDDVDWIHFAQVRKYWRALVNTRNCSTNVLSKTVLREVKGAKTSFIVFCQKTLIQNEETTGGGRRYFGLDQARSELDSFLFSCDVCD